MLNVNFTEANIWWLCIQDYLANRDHFGYVNFPRKCITIIINVKQIKLTFDTHTLIVIHLCWSLGGDVTKNLGSYECVPSTAGRCYSTNAALSDITCKIKLKGHRNLSDDSRLPLKYICAGFRFLMKSKSFGKSICGGQFWELSQCMANTAQRFELWNLQDVL